MSAVVGNIIARVGADVTPLEQSMMKAQNTILTFKNESMTALKSFGIPNISTTNLTESIANGNRVISNFSRESGESLAQFQQRVRTAFTEAGVDVTKYEAALKNASSVHAEFAKGAIRNFSTVNAEAEKHTNVFTKFVDEAKMAMATFTDSNSTMGDKFGAVSSVFEAGCSLMTGALVLFVGVEVAKKIAEWTKELMNFSREIEDLQHRFLASTGLMSTEATEFAEKLADSLGISLAKIKDMMGKEYLNARWLGFSPEESEKMSENIVKLAFNLGKLRGEDPSEAFDKLKRGVEGMPRGLSELGIKISEVDIKNRAMHEGLLKHGEELDSHTKSLMIYEILMKKTAGTQDYYRTTSDDLSGQQAKLSAQFEKMKETLAVALAPAFTEFFKIVNAGAVNFARLIVTISDTIKWCELLAANISTIIQDVGNLDFSHWNEQMKANYDLIYNSDSAAEQFGNTLDDAISDATDSSKDLSKALKDNLMSFDEVHNIAKNTSTGTSGGSALNNSKLSDALKNINEPSTLAGKGKEVLFTVKLEDLATKAYDTLLGWWNAIPKVLRDLFSGDLIELAKDTYAGMKVWFHDLSTITKQLFGIDIEAKAKDTYISLCKWWTDLKQDVKNLFEANIEDKAQEIYAGMKVWWNGIKQTASALFKANLYDNVQWGYAVIVKWWNGIPQKYRDLFKGTLLSMLLPNYDTALKLWDGIQLIFKDLFRADLANTVKNIYNDLTAWWNNLKPIALFLFEANLMNNIGSGLATIAKDIQNFANSTANAMGFGKQASIGGGALSGATPFATGGIVTQPTLAMVGEAGTEAIIPLEKLGNMMGNNQKQSGQNSASQPIQINVKLDGRTLARVTHPYNNGEAQRIGMNQGYDTAFNYPK